MEGFVKVKFLKSASYPPFSYGYAVGDIGYIKKEHLEDLIKAGAIREEGTTGKQTANSKKADKAENTSNK